MRYLNEESGLTLVELLVFIAVFGLISTGLYNIFRVHNLMAAKQEETTLMQQELLSVMVQMADELRMCGYSRSSSGAFGFAHRSGANDPDYSRATNATAVYCTLDGNDNGTLDESGTNSSGDHVAYQINVNGAGNPSNASEHRNVLKKFYTGAIKWQPVATNIADLRFVYFDADGNQIVTPSTNLDRIRSVEITATAVPSEARAGLGIGNRTMTTRVYCRNL